MRKLSATALACFLDSPKEFYWRYVVDGTGYEPTTKSTQNFDHDKVFGTIWAAFTDAFYKDGPHDSIGDWYLKTEGWVSKKIQDAYAENLSQLIAYYYDNFNPKDGVRTAEQSELLVENELFVARLDGLSKDRVIHECKSTKRAPSLDAQLWKYQASLQTKLYAVITKATGVCIELAYKDAPNVVFRAPVKYYQRQQVREWECELTALAERITSLGDDPFNYPCHPDGCSMISKNLVSLCPYKLLCDGDPSAKHFYRQREEQKHDSRLDRSGGSTYVPPILDRETIQSARGTDWSHKA
jgi:PD-(D/E)XK nuclease superfamily